MSKLCIALATFALATSASAAVPFKFGIAGYTFNRQDIDHALAAMRKVDCHYLCIKDFHLKYDASDAEIAAFKAKLAAAGVEALAAGPLYFDNEKGARMLFDFAKRYGLKTVVGVPMKEVKGPNGKKQRVEDDAVLDIVEKLVAEYDIRFAIHNHGPDMPKLYPTAASVMKRIADRDRRIGLCLDVVHERRAGADPIEAIRKYGDRIYDVHVNNVLLVRDEKGRMPYRAVPAPRGDLDIPAVFRALAETGYAGVCHLENAIEKNDDGSGLLESVGYFRGCMDSISH